MGRSRTNLTQLQIAWADAYMRCGSPKQAARMAGYQGNDNTLAVQGFDNLHNKAIQAYLKGRWEAQTMRPPEVVSRLSRQARASADLYLDDLGQVDLDRLRAAEALDLVKRTKQRTQTTTRMDGTTTETTTVEVELHDAQAALDKLARIHGLYKIPEVDAPPQTIRVVIKPKKDNDGGER